MITKSFEEISVGDIAVTDPRVVTEDYVQSFADLTWDRHPLHLDPDYAQQTRFGRQIAHGALMLSTLLGLVELDPRYLQCFYGLDHVRFHRPTYLGDSVHAVSEVLSVRPRSDGETAIVTSKGSLVNQDGDLVFSGEFSFLVGETHSLELEVGAR